MTTNPTPTTTRAGALHARTPKGEVIMRVENLVKHFPTHSGLLRRETGAVQAVDGVSLELRAGETLGLVGESGCGKSTTGRCLARLVEPTHGSIVFKGRDITTMPSKPLREIRREVQMVFQDPYASINPRMTVRDIIAEPLRIHGHYRGHHGRGRVDDLLAKVGMNREHGNRYPHEFSGGQRQRIGIARALALNPQLLILDEPVSALDVSIQAQVVNLLQELQDDLGLSFLFIAHDLSVIRHISDRVAVMYLGKIVEIGSRQQIFTNPVHPYTQALLSAVSVPDPAKRSRRDRIVLRGDVPSPSDPPSGCRFRTRCWKADQRCVDEVPALVSRGYDHPSACHYAEPRSVIG